MSDLFHDEVPVEWIGRIFQQMRKHNHHQYIVLTKRPERAAAICGFAPIAEYYKHICIGVSICTQEEFDRIYPIWRKTHIACRAISFEPLLSPIQVSDLSGIDWAIVGGESGSGSRPFRSDWARTLLAASRKSNTRFFFKQLGQNSDLPVHKKGGDFADIPADLRVRELPLGWQ
jgi:protein gp37